MPIMFVIGVMCISQCSEYSNDDSWLNVPSLFSNLLSQEMTPEAEIISTRFTKSVIKSCAALSYVEAQARMDDRCSLFNVL